jgi:hypothetical protein
MRRVGHVASTREIRNAYKTFVRQPERKRSFVRFRCRWENNIKLDLKETGYCDVDGIPMALA